MRSRLFVSTQLTLSLPLLSQSCLPLHLITPSFSGCMSVLPSLYVCLSSLLSMCTVKSGPTYVLPNIDLLKSAPHVLVTPGGPRGPEDPSTEMDNISKGRPAVSRA